MAKKRVSLYIDDAAIYCLLMRGRQPQKWARVLLEPGLVKDGLIQNEAAIADKIKELLKSLEIRTRKVIVGISGINCLYSLLSLPEIPRDLLPEAIRREASRVLGISLEEIYLSWQVVYLRRGEMVAYLAASPRNSMDALVSTLRRAELDPYLMDIKPLCLARATNESRAIIADLQPTSFDIIILVNGIPEVVRSSALPEGASSEDKIAILKEELDRAVTFYNSAHMDRPIDPGVPLLVSGELAWQEDAWPLLSGRQKRSVQALPSPLQASAGFPPAQYMTNIGLALKETLPAEKKAVGSLVNLNALPEIYQPKPRELSQILFVPTVAAGIAIFAVLLTFNILASGQNSNLSADLDAVNEMAARTGVRAGDITALRGQVSSVEASANALQVTLNGFANVIERIDDDLAEINYYLPEGVDLQQISLGSNVITLNGIARSEEDYFIYWGRLRESPRFSSVFGTFSPGEHDVTFIITLTR
jgi:type IV pilus assembly protein PilM